MEYVWWLLIVARPLTIYLTVQHLQNDRVLAIVSDVAVFKRSMSTPVVFLYEFILHPVLLFIVICTFFQEMSLCVI